MDDLTRALAPLPVLLPLLGAAFTLAVRGHVRTQRVASILVLSTVVVVSFLLLIEVDAEGPAAVQIGAWPAPMGITVVVDRLAALLLVVSSAVTLIVLIYAVGQGIADSNERAPLSIFYPTYLVLTAGVAIAFVSGDLFNLYVGFEVLLCASYVLLTLGGTGPRIQAGVTYVVVGLLSSFVFLTGIALVYAATGTLNLAQIGERMQQLPPATQTVLQIVLLVGFGIKAAVFPLSAWLPDSYPTALAPVTAVFAGLLTKVGVYAIIRTQTELFVHDGQSTVLLVAALATMLVGILGAIAQSDIKRMLSFTLVSHIGYMLFGIGLGTAAGLAGAVFYVVHHIAIQTTLFLIAGLIERHAGSTSLDRLRGLAASAPLLAVLFFVAAMNLGGIPPLSGFIGKLGVIQAGLAVGGPLANTLVAVAVATSLLTLYAICRVWALAFWRPARDVTDVARVAVVVPRTMVSAAAALLISVSALTVAAGPVYSLGERAIGDLINSRPTVPATDSAIDPVSYRGQP